MLQIGSALLTAVLLGVPRALETRTFGAASRPVFVEVSRLDARLADFTAALEREIVAACHRLVGNVRAAPAVVEIHNVWAARKARAPQTEAACVTVRRGYDATPMVVQYVSGCRQAAARTLIQALARRKEETWASETPGA
jgi:hypothetical protein